MICWHIQGGGVAEGGMPPSEAGKFCIFETGFVEFGVVLVQIKSR